MDSTLRNMFEFDFPGAVSARDIHGITDFFYLGRYQKMFETYKAGYYRAVTEYERKF